MSLYRPIYRYIALCLVGLTLSSIANGSEKLERYHFNKVLMATRFQIILYCENSAKAEEAAEAAFQIAKNVELVCSDYLSNSELSLFLKPPATQAISPLLAEVFQQAISISKETQGAFDPTIGGHSQNWRNARKEIKLPSEKAIHEAREINNWENLTVVRTEHGFTATKKISGMKIDLGGIAKGYAADLMLDSLSNNGVTMAIIAAGGDIRLGDAPPGKKGWRVGLKTLGSQVSSSQDYIIASNCAVSTSGDIHQFVEISGKRYSHIVDPATGLGLTKRISATVVAPNAARADALATACCVQPDLMMKRLRQDTATLIVTLTKGQQIQQNKSPNFPEMNK